MGKLLFSCRIYREKMCKFLYTVTSKNLLLKSLLFLFINTSSEADYHWRRLVKNIGWANQNIGEKVVKSDKSMGVSQLYAVYSLICCHSSNWYSSKRKQRGIISKVGNALLTYYFSFATWNSIRPTKEYPNNYSSAIRRNVYG